MAKGDRGTWILLAVLFGLFFAVAGGFVVMFFLCGGLVWTTAPGDTIAQLDVPLGEEFTLDAPTSPETAREVMLFFDVEYPLTPPTDPEWGLSGWVEVEGIRFDLDLAPGSDGVVGFPTDWEDDLELERWYAWAAAEGMVVVAALPIAESEGGSSTVKGQIWNNSGTEVVALQVLVRE